MPDEQQLTALRVGVVRRVGSTVPRTSAAPHVRLRLGSGQRVIAPAGGRGVRPPLDLLDGLQHLAAMGDQLAQLGAVGAVSAGGLAVLVASFAAGSVEFASHRRPAGHHQRR